MEGGTERRTSKPHVQVVCLVPGCHTDLSCGPHYLKRHKICQFHLKAKSVVVEGREVRFCQQCGRLQPLEDFKDDQRSCEAALAAHNARRRVKKDPNAAHKGSSSRSKGSKRVLAALLDDSSSEDGAVGVSRKAAAPRKCSSQRSAPSNLQQSAAGSDSLKGGNSEDCERPLSDGAHGCWGAGNASPNSYDSAAGLAEQMQLQYQLQHMASLCAGNSNSGSPAGMECDQLQQQLHMLQQHVLPDGSCLGGQHMLHGNSFDTCNGLLGAGGVSMPACCGPHTALLQQQQQAPQHMSLHSAGMAAVSQAEQALLDPSFGGNSCAGQADSLEAWMVPHGVMQEQAAQLQQFWSPVGSGGLQEAMGQSLMLQQAVQEHQKHQMMLMAQPHIQQQPPQPQPQYQQYHHQQQQLSGLLSALKDSKVSGGESSGTTFALSQDAAAGAAAADTAAAPSRASPACAPLMPATSAAAAAALASQPMLDLSVLTSRCVDSGSTQTMPDAADAAAAAEEAATAAVGPKVDPAAASMGVEASTPGGLRTEEDAELLDQALEVLLASGHDWQMDDVLLGPQAHSLRSGGTNSGMMPVATTSSPSSSNMNGGNTSGPLSVPSLPSATASAFGGQVALSLWMPGQQGAACGLAALAAGLADALRVGSPSKGSGSMLPAASTGGILAAGGNSAAMAGVDDLMPPAGGIGSVPAVAGGGGAAGGTFLGLSAPAVSSGAVSSGPAVFHGRFASLGHGGPASYGPGSMPCGLTSTPAAANMLGGGGTLGMAATAAMLQPVGALGVPHGGTQGVLQHDAGFSSVPGPLVPQTLWHQQRQQDSLLLQQQLMMQQQQEAEVLLQQQQQHLQRRQQLMQLQQNINARMTNTQQLVRLSIKLHGVTPDQLPSSTVLAMERLLLNNPHDIETILLQPSLRQGCIQFEFDILVKCPAAQQQQQQQTDDGHASAQQPAAGAATYQLVDDTEDDEDDDEGAETKPLTGSSSNIAATVAALDSSAATQAAEAKLRLALPFSRLVSVLLDLPLRQQAGSPAGATVRQHATAIYAQVGDCLGAWKAASGLVQDWASQLPLQRSSADAAEPTAGSRRSSWRPSIRACMPVVTAAPESFDASSPTAAAAAAGRSRVLKPLPLKVQLQAASGNSGISNGPIQLWCTRRELFLPLAIRPTPDAAAAGATGQQQQQPQDVQVVTALLDSTPGLLLLQAEQPVLLSARGSSGSGAAAAEADQAGCMSSLVPVVLCPSAAMAAEVNAHLLVTNAYGQSGQKLLQLGLVLDFWAMYRQQEQQHVARGARAVWQAGLLRNRKYLHTIKAMGTQLMLNSVISGMTATSSHLHSIMTALRALEASTAADAAASAAAAPAPAAASTAAPAPTELANAGAANAGADATASDTPVDAASDGGCSSPMQVAGTSAAAAAGVKPVQEWVFEDVDCKGSGSGGSADTICDDGSAAEGGAEKTAQLHKLRQPGRPASPVQPGSAAGVEDGQQSPLTIFKGAAQMMAMLLVMYLLLEVAAAVYKGRSPAKQLLASLLHLRELMGVMLVPLAMMCLGGVLAVWQFGLTGTGPGLLNQQRRGRAMLAAGGAGGFLAASNKGAVAAGGDGADTDAME